RDICACDQQDKSDGAQQHQQRGPRACDDFFMEREYVHPVPGVDLILLLELSRDRVHIRLRLLKGHTGFEPRQHLITVSATTGELALGELKRDPNLGPSVRIEKIGGHHSDDDVIPIVEPDWFTDDFRVRCKASLPKRVAYYRDCRALGFIVILFEGASH